MQKFNSKKWWQHIPDYENYASDHKKQCQENHLKAKQKLNEIISWLNLKLNSLEYEKHFECNLLSNYLEFCPEYLNSIILEFKKCNLTLSISDRNDQILEFQLNYNDQADKFSINVEDYQKILKDFVLMIFGIENET